MTTIITTTDNRYWKPLVISERARERIDEIKKETLQLNKITNDALAVVRREIENWLIAYEQENQQQLSQIQVSIKS